MKFDQVLECEMLCLAFHNDGTHILLVHHSRNIIYIYIYIYWFGNFVIHLFYESTDVGNHFSNVDILLEHLLYDLSFYTSMQIRN